MNYSTYSLDHGHIQKANFNNSPDTRKDISQISYMPVQIENHQINKFTVPTDKDITIASMRTDVIDHHQDLRN